MAAVLLVAVAGSARAHAAFVSSDPAPGSELSVAPPFVVLSFTEPLNAELSRAEVTDPQGQISDSSAGDQHEIRVPVPTNAPGIYEVAWTTVSTVDGHTLRGTFQFGVGVAPGPGGEGSTGTGPARGDLIIAIARTVEYVGLLLVVGMLLVLGLARRSPAFTWVRPRVGLALGIALVGGLGVVAGEALSAAAPPTPAAIGAYLTAGPAGIARIARLTAEALALVAWMWAPVLVAPLAGIALLALAAAGHAAAVRPAWAGILVDGLHLIAAGLWAGGILALAILRPAGGWRGSDASALIKRFSPWAVSAFLITVAAGTVRGLQELGGLDDLFTTSYGRVLALKVLGVLFMVPLSLLTWRRIAPSPRGEGLLAVVVIAAAGLLAAFPLPPGRAGEAELAEERSATEPALPRPGDLTLGGDAGTTLVALTIRPAEPGENRVMAFVLPIEGEEAAPRVVATLSVDGRSVRMHDCGATCRDARLDLDGGERVRLHIGGRGGGTASFRLPRLPAPDAIDLLRRMQRRMHELETYRFEEVLGPVEPPYRATYAFQAPNRFRVRAQTGAERIQIGDVQYRREGPRDRWLRDDAAPLDVPRFIWDGGDFTAARVVGQEIVRGVPASVVSFQGGTGVPIWFRLYVDGSGLVRRAEMRAQGHFMNHRYFGFDGAFEIDPPDGGVLGGAG